MSDHESCVRYFITGQHGVDDADENGYSPLMHAVTFGSESCVDLIIAAGSSLDRKCKDGLTALMLACLLRTESHRIAQRIIDAGADVNAQTPDGTTALMWVMSRGNDKHARQLLRAGADVHITNTRGEDALTMACGSWVRRRLAEPCITLLLDHGADTRARADGKFPADDLAHGRIIRSRRTKVAVALMQSPFASVCGPSLADLVSEYVV
jgi:ankyrin repeat protein